MVANTHTLLSDTELLAETARVAAAERRVTAELIALLVEIDTRKLYLGLGHSSLFVYCTQTLRLSESAAYGRITAARAARQFPVVLALLADGTVTLTTVNLLAAHLTDENHEALMRAASHQSRREVERLVASLDPQPDVASSLRRLPVRRAVASEPVNSATIVNRPPVPSEARPAHQPSLGQHAIVAPLAADRYLLKITVTESTRAKLNRARDLLRHQIPAGDPAAIVDRALTVLVEQLERTRHATVRRPRTEPPRVAASPSRHVPAAVKRAVWARDEGRCAFVGMHGRCSETGFLELHHVVPFAERGPSTAANLQLRCRAHNAYESTLFEQSSGPGL
jgi:hypothetical protein